MTHQSTPEAVPQVSKHEAKELEQLDVHKQAGQWARLYKQVKAAEERLRQTERGTSPSQSSPSEFAKYQSEFAKQRAAPVSEGGAALPPSEDTIADERQEQLHALASDLLSWKGGLKVLRQAQLPKWRGHFKWQIEALQTDRVSGHLSFLLT